MKKITNKLLQNFKTYLESCEKAPATIEKYIRDIRAFSIWLGERPLDKAVMLQYKNAMIEQYAPQSVNSVLSSVNSFLEYMQWCDCKVKTLKIQKQIFSNREKELTKAEYESLLTVAKNKNYKLYLLLVTVCSTGIRVSELQHISVASVKQGSAFIRGKGKMRIVILPEQLCSLLSSYVKEKKIQSGPVFVTKGGKPLDRSNIWKMFKKLCQKAKVPEEKVFPHNLRHLFARTYYSMEKDVVKLADILGHSNINTTRIYTMETGEEHRKQIQRLGLVYFGE